MAVLVRDTCHADLLRNWGTIWVRHGAFLAMLGVATNAMQLAGVHAWLPYAALWVPLLAAWAALFWRMRQERGPITFVERQLFHVWAGSCAGIAGTLIIEMLMGLPVLTLAPTIALASASTFLVKAGILTGEFYAQAAALYLTAGAMAVWPRFGLALFGVVSGLCFAVPGWRYRR